jgi:hypothetical protein
LIHAGVDASPSEVPREIAITDILIEAISLIHFLDRIAKGSFWRIVQNGWGGRILTSESPDPNPLKEREFYTP